MLKQLEQAYIELQKKLGEPNEDEQTESRQEAAAKKTTEEEEVLPVQDLLSAASDGIYEKMALSKTLLIASVR